MGRSSNADWYHEQQQNKPGCEAAIRYVRYVHIGRPAVLPRGSSASPTAVVGLIVRHMFDLAIKGLLFTNDEGFTLLAQQHAYAQRLVSAPSSIRINVPMIMRYPGDETYVPTRFVIWEHQTHFPSSTSRQFYWWIAVSLGTWRRSPRCLRGQPPPTALHIIWSPVVSTSTTWTWCRHQRGLLRAFLPTTPRGSACVLLFRYLPRDGCGIHYGKHS